MALLCETDAPADHSPIDSIRTWSMAQMGTDGALAAALEWSPTVALVNSFSTATAVSRLIGRVPVIFFCHDYVGTCISGQKSFQLPVFQPCSRTFGPACLAHFFPHHCGGWNPVTMFARYSNESARLDLLRQGYALVTASEAMRGEYLRHGFAPDRVYRNGYPAGFPPAEGGPEPHALGNPVRLLFAGRMYRWKGGDLLLESLPLVTARLGRGVRALFAGDGPCRESWVKKAARLGVTADFSGWLGSDALRREMAVSDLLVVPSVWPEPLGLVGAQASSLGLPAAGFRVGGIPEWLADGVNGHLASGEPPTVIGLAAAIAACLEDPIHYETLRAGALRAGSNLNSHPPCEVLIDILERAARSH